MDTQNPDYSEMYLRSRGSTPRLWHPGWDRDYPQNTLNLMSLRETLPEEYLNGGRAGRGETHSCLRISLLFFYITEGFPMKTRERALKRRDFERPFS